MVRHHNVTLFRIGYGYFLIFHYLLLLILRVLFKTVKYFIISLITLARTHSSMTLAPHLLLLNPILALATSSKTSTFLKTNCSLVARPQSALTATPPILRTLSSIQIINDGLF